MTQTVSLDELQEMSPEVVMVEPLIEACSNREYENDEGDIFQCGKCKEQFNCLETFLKHKKIHQLGNNYNVTQSLLNFSSAEPDLQFQPVIQAFSIDQPEFTISASNEVTEEVSELHIMPDCVQADTDSLLGTSIICLDNVQLVTDNNIYEEEVQQQQEVVEEVEHVELQNEDEEKNIPKKLPRKKLTCYFCSKHFTKNFDLRQHIRSHTGERPFQCVVCGRSFTQKSNVKKHMMSHKVWPKKMKTLPDKPSQKKITSSTGQTVVQEESYVCQYCPETFPTFHQLKAHRKKHSEHKVFRCIQEKCFAEFESLNEFLTHVEAHQEAPGVQYRCFHCSQLFTSLDCLNAHQFSDICRFKKKSVLTCKLCKAKFSSPLTLERHQAADPHSYPCHQCAKVFVSERLLRQHLKTHSSAPPTLKCPDCDKMFHKQHNLTLHKAVHSSEKPFSCAFCSAKFARPDLLNRHTHMHDPKRRFKCPFNKQLGCTMEFYRNDKLKQHLLSHSTSVKCERCSRVFKRSSQMKRHREICLSEDQPCKDCGHITTSLDNYKNISTVKRRVGQVSKHKPPRSVKANKKADVGVSTLQVVVVPLNKVGTSEQQPSS